MTTDFIDTDGVIAIVPFFRTEYNYDRDKVSQETALVCKDPSKTRQEFLDDANINVIVERFGIGHELPLNNTPPQTGDFTNIPDFRGAQDLIRKAQEVFGNLPAKIRAKFDNDPAKYIDWFHDPDNEAEAIRLGLATKPAEPQNNPVEPVTPPEPPKPA